MLPIGRYEDDDKKYLFCPQVFSVYGLKAKGIFFPLTAFKFHFGKIRKVCPYPTEFILCELSNLLLFKKS